jgi:threonine/homoserine/homoserine lactone efflux protein
MNALLPFALGVLALLATPGPTNTLLAASGAAVGFRASLVLLPAELCGYLLAIGALGALVGPAVAASPALGMAVRLAAGAYLAWSAWRLWRAGRGGVPAAPAAPGRVFVTTLLNPKALVFAFVLFPGHDAATAAAVFSGLVTVVALGWILIGASAGRAAGGLATPARIARATALAQAAFATVVTGTALGAVL